MMTITPTTNLAVATGSRLSIVRRGAGGIPDGLRPQFGHQRATPVSDESLEAIAWEYVTRATADWVARGYSFDLFSVTSEEINLMAFGGRCSLEDSMRICDVLSDHRMYSSCAGNKGWRYSEDDPRWRDQVRRLTRTERLALVGATFRRT